MRIFLTALAPNTDHAPLDPRSRRLAGPGRVEATMIRVIMTNRCPNSVDHDLHIMIDAIGLSGWWGGAVSRRSLLGGPGRGTPGTSPPHPLARLGSLCRPRSAPVRCTGSGHRREAPVQSSRWGGRRPSPLLPG